MQIKLIPSVLIACAILLSSYELFAQRQLVVLKNEKVLLRLYPGDEFVFSTKGSKKLVRSYINNLYDTAVLAHQDIVPLHQLDKIFFKRRNLLNVAGKLFLTAGIGYFVIDQLNNVIVQGNEADIDNDVAVTSAVLVGASIPFLVLKKNYAPIRGKHRVLVVDKGSPFFRADPRIPMDEGE